MKVKDNIFALSIFFGFLLFLIDALMDSLIFHTGTFWSSLFSGVPVHEIRERLVMVIGFVAFGIIVSRIMTGRRRAEEALRRSEEEAKRVAQENAIMAEIGQIISSTLNLEEVYIRFAEVVRKLIQFDRMAIHILNPQDHTFSIAFALGPIVAERQAGKVVALAGTANEWVLQNRSSLCILEENREELIGRMPSLLPLYEAGLRSMMFTPLISKDQVIGLLNIHTVRQSAYTERDLKLAEKVSMQISGAIANAQLFQEQKRAEEKSRSIIRAAMDGFWITDVQGHFLDVNDAYCRLIGYSRDELVSMGIHDVEARETSEETEEHIRRVKEVGSDRFETRHRCRDGRIVDIEASVNYMESGGGQFFVFLRDITERKRAEEALAERTAQLERTNRELVALNAELDDFTNVASHDLQEPLRTLAAFSDMLRKDLDQSLPERAAQDLGFITDAAKRMQTLIQDLLALSRAGRVAKKREKISLGECADRALEALAIRMKETAAQVTRDELPEVWGDSTLLTQLYQNLIGNALKFCGDQPPVIRLTAEEQDGSLIFGVKDNGIGMESKYAHQIFQPFRRLHGRGKYEGSGIGLAICRKIVERHGGKIWVDSELGKGAHFRFTISHRRRE
jgi:PAS domain S-box-containing protein